jgi:hypothetical protein
MGGHGFVRPWFIRSHIGVGGIALPPNTALQRHVEMSRRLHAQAPRV